MWSELLEIFRSGDPMKGMGDEFMKMLHITSQMAQIVRPHVYDSLLPPPRRKEITELDLKLNRHERSIRKQIVSHLSLNRSNVPYCLALLMLVHHAERVGDYLQNIAKLERLGGGEVPQGPLRDELTDLIDISMRLQKEAPRIIAEQDRAQAEELVRLGRSARERSDRLLVDLSKSDLNALQVTSMVLLTRFFRRITGHMRNILSSVVAPVHLIDHYGDDTADEDQ